MSKVYDAYEDNELSREPELDEILYSNCNSYSYMETEEEISSSRSLDNSNLR